MRMERKVWVALSDQAKKQYQDWFGDVQLEDESSKIRPLCKEMKRRDLKQVL